MTMPEALPALASCLRAHPPRRNLTQPNIAESVPGSHNHCAYKLNDGHAIPKGSEVIVIVDYGMGNLRSVAKAFERLDFACAVSSDADQIATADKLVLPGVGAFCDAMGHLRNHGFVEPIRDFLKSSRPFLGICLGLQMLFARSFEDGEHTGLGVFAGDIVRFDVERPLKVPHMGWNMLHIVKPVPIFDGLPPDPLVYFVHSYHAMPTDRSIVAAESDHGGRFVAAIQLDNIFATQFHPEKSQRVGLRMLENFARL